jgi:CRP/FNR family transcriptional regulator, cyclic AMP receptor protein
MTTLLASAAPSTPAFSSSRSSPPPRRTAASGAVALHPLARAAQRGLGGLARQQRGQASLLQRQPGQLLDRHAQRAVPLDARLRAHATALPTVLAGPCHAARARRVASRPMNAKRLSELPLFDGLEPDDVNAVAKAAQEVSVQEGAELVREGDYSYDLTIIDEGQAEVVHEGQVIATLGPGDVFGEAGVLSKSVRNADVRATTPMRLITLTGWDLRRLRNRIPALQDRLNDLASARGES